MGVCFIGFHGLFAFDQKILLQVARWEGVGLEESGKKADQL